MSQKSVHLGKLRAWYSKQNKIARFFGYLINFRDTIILLVTVAIKKDL